MKLKFFPLVLLSISLIYSPIVSAADNFSPADLLTGDVRLACEATLCLSSGERPNECAPSIRRYFSINHRKLRDTLNARRDFLKLCPASKEKGMDGLVEALVHGAGRCDAKELNRIMKTNYQEYVCSERPSFSRDSDPVCKWVTKSYVRNAKPHYCTVYFNHEWTTTGDKVRFIGKEKQGGKWVDVK